MDAVSSGAKEFGEREIGLAGDYGDALLVGLVPVLGVGISLNSGLF